MKKAIMVFAFVMSVISISFAQQVKDYKGHLIDAKGDIYFNGTKIGSVSKDQFIKDAKGQKVGFIDNQGNLTDGNGKKMGHWGKDGKTYFDPNNDIMLKVVDNKDETCNIYDAKGNKLGNVHDSYKSVACAIHCFDKKMSMKDHTKH
ncbi:MULTISPECIES: 5-fold beta-flower protein [unclassified Arcicella]|uniref:5-fold beta-flower protein n=1 Tax=unclassified Arcicella TaxID=2644986 RepID=UPI002864050B|nr:MULTISPECIES: hypothetical protein [unclassified Arcicella]MDR6561647.1 hypothetical protein [Arcicella sp. BE51]MDR6812427.1 hypothetical protein [Arcicella sp. BE140]MDR6823801.1 hypothetical protein [Arcicella sp. BE139]